METGRKNKAMTGENGEQKAEARLKPFNFPSAGITIWAESLNEANRKYQEQIQAKIKKEAEND
jgi:hypothetical protein